MIGAGPFILPKLKHPNGGVDFLGMRQVNLDLMGECLPGVNNNATRHIRPFAVLSWVHWKYQAILSAGGERQGLKGELRRFQEKAEVLFTWGHKLRNIQGAPGSSAACPEAPGGWADLTFEAWARKPQNTSLQAAVQYGPAFRSQYGLGFAEAVDGGFSKVTPDGAELAEALDSLLSRNDRYDLLIDLAARKARDGDALALLPAWQVDQPSKKEQEIFRRVFFDRKRIGDGSSFGKRSATIQGILAVLRTSKAGLDEEQIRRGLAQQRGLDGRVVKLDEATAASARRWLVLQVRQAQRAALECFLSWFEWKLLSGVCRIESLRAEIRKGLQDDELSDGGRATCGEMMERFCTRFSSLEDYHTCCAQGDDRCFFDLVDVLFDHLDNDATTLVPAVAAILTATIAETIWLEREGKEIRSLLGYGGSQRISLEFQRQDFLRNRDTVFADWLVDVLERWIISQHFWTATYRFDGRSQRLRFTFEEDGLEFIAGTPLRPVVSLDHLEAALSLMTECGIIGYDPATALYICGS